jgi:hypothetical protein
MRRSLLVLAAIAGCSSSDDAPGASSVFGPSCSDRASELGAWVAAIEPEAEAAQIDGDHLAPGPDLPLARWERGTPLVHLTRAGATVDGVAAQFQELPDRVAEARTRRGETSRPNRVIIAIDADVWIDQIYAAMGILANTGVTDVGFAFRYTGKVHSAPAASSISAQIDAIRRAPPEQRPTQIAQLGTRVIERCKPLGDVFASFSADPDSSPDERHQRLIRSIAPALTACGCAVDLDAFRELMWSLEGRGKTTPTAVIDVTLVRAFAPSDIVVRGSSWADHVNDVIAAKGKRVDFEPMPRISR